MKHAMELLCAQPVLYMRRTGAYGSENYKLMAALKEWAEGRGLLRDSVIYAVAHDDERTPPEQCRYDVCLAVHAGEPADGAVRRGEIPGGKYAVFVVHHTAQAVQEFWGSVIGGLQAQIQLDTTRRVLERYRYQLVEEGFCEFCVPVL